MLSSTVGYAPLRGLLRLLSTACFGVMLAFSMMHLAPDLPAHSTFKLSSASADSSGVVPVGAGGWVTGLSFSDDGATRLARTDTYGAYRWAASASNSEGALLQGAWALTTSADTLPTGSVRPGLGGGVLAVAASPSNSQVAYMAYDNSFFRSTNGATSWRKVGGAFSTQADDNFRIWGPRLVVDPANPNVVFYGTQKSGLQVSTNGGDSWTGVPTTMLPSGIASSLGSAGVNSIAIDRTSVSGGRSQRLYATSYGSGVYASNDAGSTWTNISPAGITAADFLRTEPNGDLVITGRVNAADTNGVSSVWLRAHDTGKWSQITPPRQANWHALATDIHANGAIAVMANGGQLAYSADNGRTWSLPSKSIEQSASDVPWLAWSKLENPYYYFAPGELAFDPVTPGRLWLSEGVGVWHTDLRPAASGGDLTPSAGSNGSTVTWHAQSRGIEQLVPTDVVAPPGGRPVVAAWDRPLFRIGSLQEYPSNYGPTNQFSSAWSIDYSAADPNYLVASIASHFYPSDPSPSGFSTDGGITWQPFPSVPLNSTNSTTTFGFGTVAVSSPGNIVWVPSYGKRPYYTKDGGRSWAPVVLPGVSDYSLINNRPYYVHRQVIAADKAVPGRFYLYAQGTGIFTSTDGGVTWTKSAGNLPFAVTDTSWNFSLKAVPGQVGNLYASPGPLSGITNQPFWHSTDGGVTWSRVPGVSGVTAFGFGAATTSGGSPTVFIAGYVQGQYGVSTTHTTRQSYNDGSLNWQLITQYPAGNTALILSLDGDKNVPGLAYLSMTGAGWTWVSANSEGPQVDSSFGSPETTPQPLSSTGATSVTPTGAAEGVVKVATTLKVRPTQRKLEGRLVTSNGASVSRAPVQIQVQRHGKWRTVARPVTDANGNVTITIARRRAVARMVFLGGGEWWPSRSAPVRMH